MTDAALRYLVEVEDRDLKDLQKRVRDTNKLLGAGTARAAKEGSSGLSKLGASASRTAKGIGKLSVVLGGALVAGAAVAGKRMVDMASDAAEVASKMQVTFGKAVPAINKEIDAFVKATGASRYEMRQQAADMGALLRPILKNTTATAGMSTQFVKLASDLGSFNNVPTADALTAIRAGLVGEAEPLRRFGVLINDAAVKAEAYASGLAKTGAELTEQQKVQARANLIMAQTTLAQGDAERTSGSMANQMKRLRNQVTDAATSLGTSLIPIALQAVSAFNTHWPTIERIARQVLGAIMEQGRRLVSWFQANWPTIRRVSLGVFTALQSAWNSVLKPVLGAIVDALGFLARAANEHWPRIRAAAESVIAWYRSTLQPTITSVINTIAALWDRFGGSITAVARAAFGILSTIVGGALRTVKAVIDTALALLRGDWGKAWEGLKTIVSTILGTLADVARQTIVKLIPAMVGLGWDIVRGIASGLRDGASSVIKSAIDWALDQIPGWAKKVLGISSPSRVMAIQVGVPISEGIAKGMLDGKIKVTDAMVKLADAALERAQAAFSSRFSGFGAFVQRAFQAKQGGALTASERKMAVIDAKRAADQLARSLSESETALGEAIKARDDFVADEDMKEAEIVARRKELERAAIEALRQFEDAKTDLELAKLRERAEQERQELENRQFVEQQKFEQRLAALQTYLESGHATAKGATNRIHDLLSDFGIEVGGLGEDMGRQFANGIRASIPQVVAAAIDMAESAKTKKIIGTAAKAQAAKAAAAKKKSKNKTAREGGPASSGAGGSILSTLLGFAGSQGITVTSTTGGKHAAGSYHYQGRAIDVDGGYGANRSFFLGAIDRFGVGAIKELFFDPMDYYIDNGAMRRGAIGGHRDHVHLALARGGIVTGQMLGDTGAAGRRREAVLPLESAHGRRVLVDALREAFAGAQVGNGAAAFHADTLVVRDESDITKIGAQISTALAVRR